MPSPDPILVVGAGPAGLTLACELVRHGAEVRIIDRLPGIRHIARATGVHSRTLEVFDDLGIAAAIIEQAAFIRGANQFAGGQLITHFRSDGLDSPYPFSASLEQWRVEEALETLLINLGARVERDTELLDYRQEAGRVEVRLRRADGSEEIFHTPWLVGCDGAHSRVRHLAGDVFPGETDPRRYLVADVALDGEHAPDEVFVYLTDQGVLWWFPLPEGRSLIAGDVPQGSDDRKQTPGLEDIQELLDHRAPAGLRAHDPRWSSWFHIHYRLAPHYRHGRCFLAGDAAHIHSPIGGQGMNTGIQDAYNLAWKLALVARGMAAESLLDSYEIERRAVAEDVLATTRNLTEKAESYVTLDFADRDRLYRYLVLPEADRLRMLSHNEELDLDYRCSPVCRDGLAEPYAAELPAGGIHAGAEARDAGPLLVEGRQVRFFDLLRGPEQLLLLLPGSGGHACAPERLSKELLRGCAAPIRICQVAEQGRQPQTLHGAPLTLVHDPEGALCARYGAAEPLLYLFRPDGYVGYRGHQDQVAELQQHLASYLNLQADAAKS